MGIGLRPIKIYLDVTLAISSSKYYYKAHVLEIFLQISCPGNILKSHVLGNILTNLMSVREQKIFLDEAQIPRCSFAQCFTWLCGNLKAF